MLPAVQNYPIFVELLTGSIITGMIVLSITTMIVAILAKSSRLPHIFLLALSHVISYALLLWLLISKAITTVENANILLIVTIIGALLAIFGNQYIIAMFKISAPNGHKQQTS